MKFIVYQYPFPQREGCCILNFSRELIDSELADLVSDQGYLPDEIGYQVLYFDNLKQATDCGIHLDDMEYLNRKSMSL